MKRLLILLLWGFALPVVSDSTLSFEESLQLAAQYNADLRNARANEEAAEHRVRASYSGYLPQVSGTVTYSNVQAPGGDTYATGLTATQNLFAGFEDDAKVQQARGNLEIAEQSLVLAKAQ